MFWPLALVLFDPATRSIRWVTGILIVTANIWRIFAQSDNIYRTDLLLDHLFRGCLIAFYWQSIDRIPPTNDYWDYWTRLCNRPFV